MDCQTVLDQAIDYALGELDGAASREVERHLAACPRCERELASIHGLFASVRALPAPNPSPAFAPRLEAKLRARTLPSERRKAVETPLPLCEGIGAWLSGLWSGLPGWAVSAAVHAGLMLVLMRVVFYRPQGTEPLTVAIRPAVPSRTDAWDGRVSADRFVAAPPTGTNAGPEARIPLTPAETGLPFPPRIEAGANLPPGEPRVSEETLSAEPLQLSVRVRREADPFPGTSEEALSPVHALDLAHRWLLRAQGASGLWIPDAIGNAKESDLAGSAAALLALLHAEESEDLPARKERKAAARRGLQGLLALQRPNGSFPGTLDRHAMATLALARGTGRFRESVLVEALARSVAHLSDTQNPDGGWGVAMPTGRQAARTGKNHAAGVAWAALALAEAERADRPGPASTRRGIEAWLQRVGEASGDETLAAMSLAVRRAFGLTPHPIETRQVGMLLEHLPSIQGPGQFSADLDWAYGYFATRGLHAVGGEAWKTWRATMIQTLLRTQAGTGDPTGSWASSKNRDRNGDNTIYSTGLGTLILSECISTIY